MVKNICDNTNKVEAIYEAYTGLIRGERAFNLSSDMTTDLSNDNLSGKSFERYSQAHFSKKIGQGFKIQFNSIIDMLHQSCLQASTHVDLLLNLFNQEQESPRRMKRQAGVLGGISLLLGIYNSYEIYQLSSKVDQIEQAEKHIVTSVKHVIEQTSYLAEDVKNIDRRLNQLSEESSFREFENELTAMAQLQLYASNQQLIDITRTIDSIYDAFSGKFSPKLVKTKDLATALSRLEVKAFKSGFKLISASIPHLFEMQTSMITHIAEQEIDLVLHIPARTVNSGLSLFKILPIPFPIPRGDNPSSASSWTITHENNYIVANQPQSVYYEVTEQQLNDCIMISKDYYCRQLLQQTPKATTTCLMAIFRSEFHNIHRLCNIEIQQTKEQAIPLNRFQILMYSPKQKIIISCGKETEKEKTIQTVEGLVIISMPHSIPCELISTRFKLKTFPYLEEAFDSTSVAIDVPINKILNASESHLNLALTSLESKGIHEITLEQAKHELEEIKFRSDQGTKSMIIFGSLGLLLLIIGLAILYIKRKQLGPPRQDMKNTTTRARFRSHATWFPPTEEGETLHNNFSTPGPSDLGTSFNTDEIALSTSELSTQAQALQELEEINKSPYAQPRRKKI